MNGVNGGNGVEEKKEDEPSMAQKVQSGFSKLTSSVSQKFMSLGVKDEHHEIKGLESGVEDEKVKLQSAKRQAKGASGNDAKYQIGAFSGDIDEDADAEDDDAPDALKSSDIRL